MTDTPEPISFEPIGVIRSCFAEKFGTPRQAGVIADAAAVLELLAPYDNPLALEGLEGFTHLWVLFVFHQISKPKTWQPTVRPPRLGGNKRVGVFASRSMFRPNSIGLSLVTLERIEITNEKICLHLRGGDFVNQTPVLDVKPYLPWADSAPNAQGGYATTPPTEHLAVEFDPQANFQCQALSQAGYSGLQELVRRAIALDPRPRYTTHKKNRQDFGMRLYDLNIRWRVIQKKALVTEITRVMPGENF